MPCERLGPSTIICSRSRRRVRDCVHCGLPAGRLCDGPGAGNGKTCDRPLCARCTHERGRRDYCAQHVPVGVPMQAALL